MNKKIEEIFFFNADKWEKTRKKGMLNYILQMGVLKLGLVLSFINTIFFYLINLDFSFNRFKIKELIDYLVWIPLIILIAIIISIFAWYENENKYSKHEKDGVKN